MQGLVIYSHPRKLDHLMQYNFQLYYIHHFYELSINFY